MFNTMSIRIPKTRPIRRPSLVIIRDPKLIIGAPIPLLTRVWKVIKPTSNGIESKIVFKYNLNGVLPRIKDIIKEAINNRKVFWKSSVKTINVAKMSMENSFDKGLIEYRYPLLIMMTNLLSLLGSN